MKNWIFSIFLFGGGIYAQQFPEGISFQSQILGSTGNILSNENIGIEINIRQGSMSGIIVWQETHSLITNDVGHVAMVVGQGLSTGFGTILNFSDIQWGEDIYFIEILVDENNTGNYVSANTQQLLAVPFAFHSKTTDQTFALSQLNDVDTAGLEIGDVLKWDGTKWVPEPDNFTMNSDTAQYAYGANNATYSDTANYAYNCISGSYADTANFSFYSDTAQYSYAAGHSIYADTAVYSDSTNIANYAINNWGINGNDNTFSGTHFLGTIDSVDLVIKTNNLERMRILGNGRIGIGTSLPLSDLHVNNTNGMLFTGSFGTGTIPIEGPGTRLMWYPGKGAFRSGAVSGAIWNDTNIGDYSFSAGYNTNASGDYSISFGNASSASGEGAISGGHSCIANGTYAVALGSQATANGDYGIALGRGDIANGYSSVALGYHAEAYADYGLAFGNYVRVYGTNGVAMGYRSYCNHDGSFIFSDQTSAGWTYTTAANQFVVKSSGGAIFYTSADLSTGVTLPAGGGAWSSLSDSTVKENIQTINPEKYLQKLDSINVYYWNYISQDSSVRHIGPMAQDFYSVFEIGSDSTKINSIDFDGVNMILLMALYEKVKELESLQSNYNALNSELIDLKSQREELWLLILELDARISKEEVSNSNNLEK